MLLRLAVWALAKPGPLRLRNRHLWTVFPGGSRSETSRYGMDRPRRTRDEYPFRSSGRVGDDQTMRKANHVPSRPSSEPGCAKIITGEDDSEVVLRITPGMRYRERLGANGTTRAFHSDMVSNSTLLTLPEFSLTTICVCLHSTISLGGSREFTDSPTTSRLEELR